MSAIIVCQRGAHKWRENCKSFDRAIKRAAKLQAQGTDARVIKVSKQSQWEPEYLKS